MAGGSQIIINDQGITVTTNGKVILKAGQHIFEEGQRVETKLPFLSEGNNYNVRYLFTDDDGIPYRQTAYTAIYPNGSEVKGKTDDEGYSSTFFSNEEKDIKIHLELE